MKHALAFILLAALGNPSAWGDYSPKIAHPPDVAYNVFVGQYGESFEFSDSDVLDAELHGPIEVIRIHPKWDPTQSLSQVPRLFKPDAADYIPANFEKYDLQELVVIPKGLPGGAKSIEQLKAVKVAEAKMSGVIFRLYDAGRNPAERWPAGTFEIWTTVPYKLVQVNTQTPGCFLIYSVGRMGIDSIGESLSYDLYKKYAPISLEPVRRVPRNMVIIWLICNGGFLILLSLPVERWHERLRLLGLNLLCFSNGLFFLGIAIDVAAISLHLGQRLHWNVVFLFVSAVGLVAAWIDIGKLKPSNPKTVAFAAAVVLGLLVWQFLVPWSPALDSSLAYGYIGMLYVCGILLGLAIGTLSRFPVRAQ